MNQNTIIAVVGALIVGGAACYFLYCQGGGWKDGRHHMSGDHMYQSSDRTDETKNPGGIGNMSGNMMDDGMAGHMMHMSVESEREFLEAMIPHHQEAVDTAKEVVARGGSTPAIKSLAEQIIIAQEAEIASMKLWYEAWYKEPYQDTGTYQPMMGDLSQLSGAALDKVFLADMVMHHMGAIMMARSVEPHIEHPEITSLTEAIIKTQTEEITLMQSLLQGLLN